MFERSWPRNSPQPSHRLTWWRTGPVALRRPSAASASSADLAAGQLARLGRLGERHPRPHQQRLDRRDGRVHRLGDLLVGEGVDLAQQQRRALGLGKILDVGDQRAEVLALLDRSAVVTPSRRPHVHRVLALGDRATEVVEAAVSGDPVEPRPHVDLAVVGEHRRVRLDEDFLQHVLGVLGRAQHVATEGEQARVVALEQHLEGVVMAVADQRDQALVALQLEQRGSPAENAGPTNGRCKGRGLHVQTRVPTPSEHGNRGLVALPVHPPRPAFSEDKGRLGTRYPGRDSNPQRPCGPRLLRPLPIPIWPPGHGDRTWVGPDH